MDKLKILLVTGEVAIEHDYRDINKNLLKLIESTGRFDVRVTEAFKGSTIETLRDYDAVFLNYDGKELPSDKVYKRWGETTEAAFFQYISEGGGVAIYHSSVWLDESLPDMFKKLWGIYLTNQSGARRMPKGDFIMKVMAESPITEGLEKEIFIVNDDLFAGVSQHPEAQVEVLAAVYDEIDNYRVPGFPPPHHPVVMPGGKLENLPGVNTDQPVCWTNRYGEGRVFAHSLGHDMDTLRRIPYMVMLLRGLEWAATGKVTLGPPDRTGQNRLSKWPYYGGVGK
ncbi:ThuA domain-containing protein [Ruminococcaceae bacterium OttesenSCG-928-D13]|nr:ThuA domain-containing protein [Ruminococcaceae bacterium OttesenSCG-928-D13]